MKHIILTHKIAMPLNKTDEFFKIVDEVIAKIQKRKHEAVIHYAVNNYTYFMLIEEKG